MTVDSELRYTTESPAWLAAEIARQTINDTVNANIALLRAREMVDSDTA